MQPTAADFELSTDPARLDVDRVHDRLSTDVYWAIGRPRERMDRANANSPEPNEWMHRKWSGKP